MVATKLSHATLAGLGVALVFAGSASAQSYSYNRGRNVSVLEHDRKDYEAVGIHAGGFTVYPKIQAQVGHTDNLRATSTNEISADYLGLTPSVDIVSNWGRHMLAASAGANLKRVKSYSSEDEDGWYVRGNGRLDIHGQSYATANLEAMRTYEGRSSIDYNTITLEPIPVKSYAGAARLVWQFNKVRLSGGGNYRKLDYSSVIGLVGGLPAPVDLSSRDRTNLNGDVKLEFAISPDTAVFGQVGLGKVDYRTALPGRQQRDSKQVSGLLGVNFDISSLARGEIGAGYTKREYEIATFGSTSGFTTVGRVEYFPSPLMTVTANLNRSVQDAVDDIGNTVSGYVSTAGDVRVDYELRRNILLMAQLDYENRDFKGISRRDKISGAALGVTYLLNRTVGVNARYSYSKRDTNVIATLPSQLLGYDENRVAISVVLQR